MPAHVWLESVVNGLSMGAIYMLMATGLTLIFGIMHILNFAHGVIYMIGAYIIYYFFGQWGFNFFASLAIAMAALAFFGLVVERFLYRPLGGVLYPGLVVFLGLSIFLESAGYLVFGSLDRNVPSLFRGVVHFAGASLSAERLMALPIALVLLVGIYLLVWKTKLGMAMRGIEENREASQLMGVNVHRINALGFVVAFALAAVGGALIAPIFVVNPSMGDAPLLKAFIIIILGGMGSIPGAVLGAIIVGLIDSVIGTLIGSGQAFLVSFVLVMLILVLRPRGLLGHA